MTIIEIKTKQGETWFYARNSLTKSRKDAHEFNAIGRAAQIVRKNYKKHLGKSIKEIKIGEKIRFSAEDDKKRPENKMIWGRNKKNQ